MGLLPLVQALAQLPERVPNTSLNMPAEVFSSVAYQVESLDQGALNAGTIGYPVALASPPGDQRLFVVDRAGIIRVIPDLENPAPEVFLDISAQVDSEDLEEGLLGLAFHPAYASNGYFYVFYTHSNPSAVVVHDDTVSRFQVDPMDPNRALVNSELMLIRQPGRQFGTNHNGGDLHFGPDGYLYISLGDGGWRSHAQVIDDTFYSALMRIDVDQRPGNLAPNPHPASVGPYAIPADNPFVGATTFNGSAVNPAQVRTEFWAVGLRNPWRFTIDAPTGDILLGDVGEGDWEEINYMIAGGNYGWPFFEGPDVQDGTPPVGTVLVAPIHAYPRSGGLSVIGGHVYRGTRLPELNGHYFFSDWQTAEIRALVPDGTNAVSAQVVASTTGFGPTAFGLDPRNGDLLSINSNWRTIARLERNTAGTQDNLPPTLADTGAFSDLMNLIPEPGVMPYDINVPFWSDQAVKSRWFSLPETNLTFGFEAEAPWDLPPSSVWIKHFDIDLEQGNPATRRRLETRFLVKTTNSLYGVTYRWNSETNAVLVAEGGFSEDLVRSIGGSIVTQRWDYPSRADCLACHTLDGGYALGFNTSQLNCEMVYGVETQNQVQVLAELGYLAGELPPVRSLRALAPLDDASVSLTWRVRSYLQANCAQCHTASGIAWDARLQTPLSQADILNGFLNDAQGDPANRVVAPGDPGHSMLLHRISVTDSTRMPPLGRGLVDTQAVALVTAWINQQAGWQPYADWSLAELGSVEAPEADFDEDLLDNYGEWLLGLDPDDAVSFFAVEGISIANGLPVIQFHRTAHRAYRVECSSNPADPASWRFLDVPGNEPIYPDVSGPAAVQDPAPAAWKTYRIRVLEP